MPFFPGMLRNRALTVWLTTHPETFASSAATLRQFVPRRNESAGGSCHQNLQHALWNYMQSRRNAKFAEIPFDGHPLFKVDSSTKVSIIPSKFLSVFQGFRTQRRSWKAQAITACHFFEHISQPSRGKVSL